MNTSLHPKNHWQEDKDWAKRHGDLVLNNEIREGLLRAFTSYCWTLPASGASPQEALCANARRQGAQEVIAHFISLANPPIPAPARPLQNLEEPVPPSQQFVNRSGQSLEQ